MIADVNSVTLWIDTVTVGSWWGHGGTMAGSQWGLPYHL